MGKKSTVSFSNLTGTKKHSNLGKKKAKKAAKFHLQEMKLSKKKFKQIGNYDGSVKKALMKYRREHADELANIILGSRLKNTEKYEEALQRYIENGKLFDSTRRKQLKKVSKKNPALFAYAHITNPFDAEDIKAIMPKKVDELTSVLDEKAAVKIAPLVPKSDMQKILRVIIKVGTEKEYASFDANDFFHAIKPKGRKKEWKETVISTVLGFRGYTNSPIKDISSYSVETLSNMPKDKIKKILRRYAETIEKVSESGEKTNFVIKLKDLSDEHRIEKVLDDNPKIASIIGQV